MSELVEKLTNAAKQRQDEGLSKLLRWAALHIAEQEKALKELREEFKEEEKERIRMEHAVHRATVQMQTLIAELNYSRPVNIELARDFAPHKNIMALHGVEPYVKKPRK